MPFAYCPRTRAQTAARNRLARAVRRVRALNGGWPMPARLLRRMGATGLAWAVAQAYVRHVTGRAFAAGVRAHAVGTGPRLGGALHSLLPYWH